MEERNVLTVEGVASHLSVDEETVRRLLRENKLAGFKVGDLWRVRRCDLDAYISQQLKDRAG